MKFKPVLFNTAMVKAIMDDSKTQTRRLIKPHLTKNENEWQVAFGKYSGKPFAVATYDEAGNLQGYVTYPYNVGDVLYIRETWTKVPGEPPYIYKATFTAGERKWRPSIHMPKAAARLFLRVTNVRIERLQDMSAEDCAHNGGFAPEAIEAVGIAPLFGTLWDSTVKKDDLPRYGWEANPWVYVVEFERIDRPKEWIA